MNTLKKTVAVVLAFAMVLTMGIATTAFAAYPDVPSTANYAEAVNILSNLGIIEGTDEGLFKPDSSISRAEAAAIMVRALNLQPVAGETIFSDVPADHWAAGYINTASQKEVIDGCGDGTFDPNGDVTFEQVAKMIVAALGYNIQAQSSGGWPQGYLTVASSKKITQNVGGAIGKPATRATVAKMVYNALEVDMMQQYVWGSMQNWAERENQTLLSNMGIIKAEVAVDESYYTRAADEGTYDANDKQVKLALKRTLDEKTDLFTGDVTYTADVKGGACTGTFEEGGTAAASLLGYSCVAYVGYDDDTDDPTIFAISAKNGRNTVTTVTSARLTDEGELSSNELDKSNEGTVYYWKNSSSDKRAASLTPDEDVKVYINYGLDGTYDGKTNGSYFKTLLDADGGVVNFIDNDNDGDFEFAMVSQYTQEGVVDSVRVNSEGQYVFRGMDDARGVPESYDPEDDGQLKLFLRGETYIDPSEIVAGDTITTVGDEDDAIVIYLVSSNKIDGRSSSYDPESETLAVAGKDYAASPMSKYYKKDGLRDMRNTTGTFYLNADGLISLIDGTSTATGEYGYILGVDESSKFGKFTYEVQILDAATARVRALTLRDTGLTVYQSAADNNTWFGSDTESFRVNNTADLETLYDKLTAIAKGEGNPEERVIKYTAENDAVTKLIIANSFEDIDYTNVSLFEDPDKAKAYDAEERTIGSSDPFNDNTYVFVVKKDKNDVYDYSNSDYISVVRGGRFVDRAEYEVMTFSENDVVAAAVQLSTESEVDLTQNVFVVRNWSAEVNEDDENIITFNGIQGGSSRTFSLYDDDDGLADKVAEDSNYIARGTVMLVGPVVNGFVDNVTILARAERANDISITLEAPKEDKSGSDDYYFDIAELQEMTDKNGEKLKTYVDGSNITVAGYAESDLGYYRVRANTNVTTVDYSGSRYAASTVKAGDIGDADLAPSKGYHVYVLFRVSDVDDLENLTVNNNLDAERSNVTDIVIFKVSDDGLAVTVDGNAPATNQSYNSGRVPSLDKDIPSLDEDDDVTLLPDLDLDSDNEGVIDL